MQLPDGSTLMHAEHAPYDPVKAHEYYMRTRQLKGRKKGSSQTVTVTTPTGKTVKMNPKQLAEQKAFAAHRVTEIKAKLTELNQKLKKKVAELKKAEADAKKPKSAADKHKEAQQAKKYRDKNKQKLANKRKESDSKKSDSTKDKPNTDTLEGLKTAIAETKGRLTSALAKQRALSQAK